MDELSLGMLVATVAGGVGMGVYFAVFHNFEPPRCTFRSQLITLLTIGYSFLVPLSLETALFENAMMGGRWHAVYILWAAFCLAATYTNRTLTLKRYRRG